MFEVKQQRTVHGAIHRIPQLKKYVNLQQKKTEVCLESWQRYFDEQFSIKTVFNGHEFKCFIPNWIALLPHIHTHTQKMVPFHLNLKRSTFDSIDKICAEQWPQCFWFDFIILSRSRWPNESNVILYIILYFHFEVDECVMNCCFTVDWSIDFSTSSTRCQWIIAIYCCPRGKKCVTLYKQRYRSMYMCPTNRLLFRAITWLKFIQILYSFQHHQL